jgi:uncharacterized protein involved in type VI secretion and phage assembly
MTTSEPKLYHGKHRGTVVNNVDPQQIGRLQVTVPDVPLALSSWAMPCFSYTGIQAGSWTIPSVGAGVWVEFEQGDPDYPIWTGCYFGSAAEVPALALAAPPAVPNVVLQTVGQNTFVLSDVPGPTGGILLKTATGAFIAVNDLGITISNGKSATIVMAGPTVNVNNGALVVT